MKRLEGEYFWDCLGGWAPDSITPQEQRFWLGGSPAALPKNCEVQTGCNCMTVVMVVAPQKALSWSGMRVSTHRALC